MSVRSYTKEQSALLLQSIWRGKQVRKKYGIKQASPIDTTDEAAFLVGNDPKIKGLEQYATKKGKTALIGTSGLRSLALICELSNKESIPKLIIIDNSTKVISFWKKLRTMVELSNFTEQDNFLNEFRNLLSQNPSLFRDFPHHVLTDLDIPGAKYENQDAVLFMSNLIEKQGLHYVLSIIKHMSVLTQTWADNNLFLVLKNIIDLNGIEKTYAYPSNIKDCVGYDTSKRVEKSIELLKPALSIVTDRDPLYGFPTHVYLVPGLHTPKIQTVIEPLEIPPADPYQKALDLIYSDKLKGNQTIQSYLEQLIVQIEKLKESGKESIVELTNILLATHKRLNNQMDVDAYQNLAKTTQGKPSLGMKILGGIMIAIGAVLIILGIIATAALGPQNSVIIAAGAVTTASGVGFFKSGTPTGICKLMNNIAEQKVPGV